ncbi:hypothetical protein [Spiroplasma mirum]|uniref:hypothetical protein n=1 Tax=Spiroplasma mirum TaxID=2144 RepID=UPI00064B085E|nr:hypothetical protein [Spiroplasma atrichopogonis]
MTSLSACKNTANSTTSHKPTPPPIDPDDNNNGEDENPHETVVIHSEINGYDQEKEALTKFTKTSCF